jgi:chromosomal replication initiation ATPase DnaA
MTTLINKNGFYVRVSDTLDLTIEQVFETIVMKIENASGLTRNQIFKGGRTFDVVLWRQLAMYLLTRESRFTQREMAIIIGKDRTTIIHGVKQIENAIETNYMEVINRLRKVSNVPKITSANPYVYVRGEQRA